MVFALSLLSPSKPQVTSGNFSFNSGRIFFLIFATISGTDTSGFEMSASTFIILCPSI